MGSVLEIFYNVEDIEFTGQIVYPKIIEIDGRKYITYYFEGTQLAIFVPMMESS